MSTQASYLWYDWMHFYMDWLRENSIGDLQRGQCNRWLMTIGAVFRIRSFLRRGESEVR
jgi:hypothetical protein